MLYLTGLVECAVNEIGAERLLFVVDIPGCSVAMQSTRIEVVEISVEAKQLVLRGNAILVLLAKNTIILAFH